MNQENVSDVAVFVACGADLFAMGHGPAEVDLHDDPTEIDDLGPKSLAELVSFWDALE